MPLRSGCLNDIVPPHYVELFENIAAQRGDGSVVLPFPIWREAFINDADLETAKPALCHAPWTSTYVPMAPSPTTKCPHTTKSYRPKRPLSELLTRNSSLRSNKLSRSFRRSHGKYNWVVSMRPRGF